MNQERVFMPVKDVATALGVHQDTVRKLLSAGKLAHYNFGSASRPVVRVSSIDLDRYIAGRRVETVAQPEAQARPRRRRHHAPAGR